MACVKKLREVRHLCVRVARGAQFVLLEIELAEVLNSQTQRARVVILVNVVVCDEAVRDVREWLPSGVQNRNWHREVEQKSVVCRAHEDKSLVDGADVPVVSEALGLQ